MMNEKLRQYKIAVVRVNIFNKMVSTKFKGNSLTAW